MPETIPLLKFLQYLTNHRPSNYSTIGKTGKYPQYQGFVAVIRFGSFFRANVEWGILGLTEIHLGGPYPVKGEQTKREKDVTIVIPIVELKMR